MSRIMRHKGHAVQHSREKAGVFLFCVLGPLSPVGVGAGCQWNLLCSGVSPGLAPSSLWQLSCSAAVLWPHSSPLMP